MEERRYRLGGIQRYLSGRNGKPGKPVLPQKIAERVSEEKGDRLICYKGEGALPPTHFEITCGREARNFLTTK